MAVYLGSQGVQVHGGQPISGGGGGGASNFIRGTFKGTTTGELLLNLPYQGNGYPVSVLVYPTGGIRQSAFSDLIQQYAIRIMSVIKAYTETAPTYDGGLAASAENGAQIVLAYKSNSSSATSYSNSSTGIASFNDIAATAGNSSAIKIRSAKKISVIIVTSGYGFAKDIEYTYEVTYSS